MLSSEAIKPSYWHKNYAFTTPYVSDTLKTGHYYFALSYTNQEKTWHWAVIMDSIYVILTFFCDDGSEIRIMLREREDMTKVNDAILKQCMLDKDDAGMADGKMIGGERGYWENIRQACLKQFDAASNNTAPPPEAKVSEWEQEITAEQAQRAAAEREFADKPTIGTIKGMIESASKFGDQSQVKISAGNVEDIFKALAENDDLRAEFGEKFEKLMENPKLYFERGVSEQALEDLTAQYLENPQDETIIVNNAPLPLPQV